MLLEGKQVQLTLLQNWFHFKGYSLVFRMTNKPIAFGAKPAPFQGQ